MNGHIDCLRYAHEHGAPWDERTCSNAYWFEHFKCLRYAFLMGAPWPDAPQEMIKWRDRVRNTAKVILERWRAIRNRAAKIIQYAMIPYIHRPGGPFMMREMAKFFEDSVSQGQVNMWS